MMPTTLQNNIAFLNQLVSDESHFASHRIVDAYAVVPVSTCPISNQEIKDNTLHLFLDDVWLEEPTAMTVRVGSPAQRPRHTTWQEILYSMNQIHGALPLGSDKKRSTVSTRRYAHFGALSGERRGTRCLAGEPQHSRGMHQEQHRHEILLNQIQI